MEQDATLGGGEVSQNVLLVVETSAETGWEAENGGGPWQCGWESRPVLE